MKALCNGFIAGIIAVSVGSGGMQAYYAVLAGVVAAPLYIIACLIFRQFTIDDPLENCQIYILPSFWACITAVVFRDTSGPLVSEQRSLDSLGTELLGFALISILVIVISWIYFFPIKRLGRLRVKKGVEVIGRDTLMNAQSKGLDLEGVVEKIE